MNRALAITTAILCAGYAYAYAEEGEGPITDPAVLGELLTRMDEACREEIRSRYVGESYDEYGRLTRKFEMPDSLPSHFSYHVNGVDYNLARAALPYMKVKIANNPNDKYNGTAYIAYQFGGMLSYLTERGLKMQSTHGLVDCTFDEQTGEIIDLELNLN